MPGSKEIFALRKQGATEEAYEIARQLMETGNLSLWDKRACAWVIYDKCKQCLEQDNLTELESLLNQYETLDVPDTADEKLIHEKFGEVRSKANPGWTFYKQAREKDKAKEYERAIEFFKQAKPFFEDNEDFGNNYGWTLYKRLKELTDKEHPDFGSIQPLVSEYFSLQTEKPSLLHSQILRLAEKLADHPEFDFLWFVQQWDLNNLRTEDFGEVEYQGKKFSGLAEKTLLQIATELLEKKEYHLLKMLMPWIDLAIGKYPENIWLAYKKAKILIETGADSEAEKYLLPVVKEKRKEFWAWEALGDLYRKTDIDKAIACYSRALLCGAEEKFLVSTRVDFAELLLKKELFNEARTEIDRSVKTRQENGYRIPQSLSIFLNQEWYHQAQPTLDNKPLYEQKSSNADEMVFGAIPWLRAVAGEIIQIGETRKKKFSVIYLINNEKLNSALIPFNEFIKSGSFTPGTAVEVRTEVDGDKYKILSLRKREGADWDIFVTETAVVNRLQHDKVLVNFLISRKKHGAFMIKQFPGVYRLGDVLDVITFPMQDRLKVLHVATSSNFPPEDLLTVFEGPLRYSERSDFGFAGKVYLNKELISECRKRGYEDGEKVNGRAIASFDRKKSSWGWSAIDLLN